jgi:broad specificity phosphatase PhoE
MTQLTLVRHGTTEWIEQNRLHGILDSPLSARGRREASLAGSYLSGRHFDVFYTSPIGRARQTAEIIAQSIEIQPQVLEGLQELNFGWLEGSRNFELEKDSPLKKVARLKWMEFVLKVSGEPRKLFHQRVIQTYRWILENHPGQKVLAVTHTAVHEALMSSILEGDNLRWSKGASWAAGGITEFEVMPGGQIQVIGINQSAHLLEMRSIT